MTIPDWATTISGILAVLAAAWAIHRFITKAIIRDYLSELKPNGGSSLRDSVNRLEAQMEIVLKILSEK